ncbi:MAG: hypothetical protein WBF99_04945 [Xanthobacteraceae bacterium]
MIKEPAQSLDWAGFIAAHRKKNTNPPVWVMRDVAGCGIISGSGWVSNTHPFQDDPKVTVWRPPSKNCSLPRLKRGYFLKHGARPDVGVNG